VSGIDVTFTCELCGTKMKAEAAIHKQARDAKDYFRGDLPPGWVAHNASHVSTVLEMGGMFRKGPKKRVLIFCSIQHRSTWESLDNTARAYAGEVYRDKMREQILDHKGAVVGLAEVANDIEPGVDPSEFTF